MLYSILIPFVIIYSSLTKSLIEFFVSYYFLIKTRLRAFHKRISYLIYIFNERYIGNSFEKTLDIINKLEDLFLCA